MVTISGKKCQKMKLNRIVSSGFFIHSKGKTELYSENCQQQNECPSII